MTPYALLLQACGLSHREAAEYHGVRFDTVKAWGAGKNRAPDGAMTELRELARTIDLVSTKQVQEIKRIAPLGAGVFEIGYPVDDHEAADLGFPCVGAWRAMAARVIAGLDDWTIKLVPRGSTLASAAAMATRAAGQG